jgi:hypothetical protein
MRRRVRIGGLIVLASLLAAHAGCRSTSDQTGTLVGTVKAAVSKSPIDNARITIGEATAYSDEAGLFRMEELTLGDRSVTIEAPGYHALTKTVAIKAGENTELFELQLEGASDGGASER